MLIAALFVVGEGLLQTGVAAALGAWLGRVAGMNYGRILFTIMLVVAPLSAFISSTGAVAIMVPVVMSVASRAGLSPSRLLIPMAYAALIGGMLTLIGTPPNLIASDALAAAGRPPLGFFSTTPVGGLALAAALALLALAGRLLLPERVAPEMPDARSGAISQEELLRAYGAQERLVRLRVRPSSPLAGTHLAESGLRERFGATLLAIHPWSAARRTSKPETPADAGTRIAASDLLELLVSPGRADELAAAYDLEPQPPADGGLGGDLLTLEIALTPRSAFVGRSLRELAVRRAYGVTALGLQRLGQVWEGDIASEPLRFGDALLVAGGRKALEPLVGGQRFYGDFIVAAVPPALGPGRGGLSPRAPLALAITLGMLVLIASGQVSAMVAALAAALALVLSGCVRPADLYRRMSWESLILIGAMLPMATALEKTGGTTLIAGALVAAIGAFGPLALLAGVFVLTALFSQFISNTVTAVLMMPIAIASAAGLGVTPEPLVITAAIAASAAFATPIASPVNTLVLRAGGYRFADYARAGLPLQLLVLICLLAVPFLFPF